MDTIILLFLAICFFIFFWVIVPLFFGFPGISFGGGGGFPESPPLIRVRQPKFKSKYLFAINRICWTDAPRKISDGIYSHGDYIRSPDGRVLVFDGRSEAEQFAKTQQSLQPS